MQLETFYSQILGVTAPWEITAADLDMKNQQVDVYVKFSGDAKCPVCGKPAKIHDYAKERTWRHLDSCQLQTLLHCRLPRINCETCKVKTMTPSWSLKGSRFTLLFEAFVIEVLLATKCDAQTAKILRMSEKEVLGIKNRAVDRGLERRGELSAPKALAIDEKSYGGGQKYLTILVDQDERKVVEVSKDRTNAAVKELYQIYSEEERKKVQAITMDMWGPFKSCAQKYLQQAMIIHDRYHVASHVGNALEQTRRSEQKTLSGEQKKVLKGIRFALLRSEDNRTDDDYARLSRLEKESLKTTTVFHMKEILRRIFEEAESVEEGKRDILAWVTLAKDEKISSLTRVAKMIERHIDGICNYFAERLTNSISETMNSFIQELKSRARGFKSWERYRINILFHFGKLDLNPQQRA